MDEKDKEAIRILVLNVNSTSFCLKDNYRADQLKSGFKEDDINTVGLQEMCINWAAFKPCKTLASLLHAKAESIRSVASHNKQEIENIGRALTGGTTKIMGDQLAALIWIPTPTT